MNDLAPTAQAVCDLVVRRIVDHPDEVRVNVIETGSVVRLEVSVADGDMGRVIGRRGRVAGAIRTVVKAAASKDDVDVEVEFID